MAIVPTEFATLALLSWLKKGRVGIAAASPVDGSFNLGFSSRYRATMAAFFSIATGFLVLGLVAFWREPRTLLLMTAVFGTMWLAMAYTVYDTFLVLVSASPAGVRVRSPLSGERMLPWERLRRVSYSSLASSFSFESLDGWSVRISLYRNGLLSLAGLLLSNIARSHAQSIPSEFYADLY